LIKKQADNNQIKETILEIIKVQKPETTPQLIQLIQEKTGLPEQKITQLLIELENQGKLHFDKKETPTPATLKQYVLSKKAAWYWITITLAAATAISVFTIPENEYPLVYLRSTLGTIFVLFLPGYSFIKMLFPSKLPFQTSSENMDNIERIAMSIGMSIALTPIVGLILNYTPWGIRLTPITLSLLALTLAFATAAVLRERQVRTESNQTTI
jgi:hypothetical protein